MEERKFEDYKKENEKNFEALLRAMGEDDETKEKIEEMNAAWEELFPDECCGLYVY